MTNEQLVLRIQEGENVAENMLQLYEQNRGIIYQIAKKYSAYAEMDDLMQEGYLALYTAAGCYNPEQGALFITYAGYWIKQRVQRYIDNCCSSIRIPVGVQEDVRKYENVLKEYWKEYGREPSDLDLCRRLYVTWDELQVLKKNVAAMKIRSLSEPFGEGDITLSDSVASDYDLEEECTRKLDRQQLEQDVKEVLESLPEEQQKVIRYRYFDGMTLKAAGEKLGIKSGQAKALESKAMRKMRYPGRCEKIKSYHEQYLSASPVYHVGINTYLRTWTSSVEAELGLW